MCKHRNERPEHEEKNTKRSGGAASRKIQRSELSREHVERGGVAHLPPFKTQVFLTRISRVSSFQAPIWRRWRSVIKRGATALLFRFGALSRSSSHDSVPRSHFINTQRNSSQQTPVAREQVEAEAERHVALAVLGGVFDGGDLEERVTLRREPPPVARRVQSALSPRGLQVRRK